MIRGCSLLMLATVLNPGYACGLAGAEQKRLVDDVTLYYRIENPPLLVAQHFSMQFRVCRNGVAVVPQRFKLDAMMPAHKHGMNYRAAIATSEHDLIEASGLLFHMPGHWQLIVDFATADAIQQVKLDFHI